ncbi:hypothetical protein CLF_112298 [Clonorchis sinensis]|uniref:Uncharacterized protein n=1 Tax=Clonorchis sinensis TaxID=79923 RepID=H2KT80_CLOSI|nr:hypothetical protein CLF_112298 [Clonorchis sinensis]
MTSVFNTDASLPYSLQPVTLFYFSEAPVPGVAVIDDDDNRSLLKMISGSNVLRRAFSCRGGLLLRSEDRLPPTARLVKPYGDDRKPVRNDVVRTQDHGLTPSMERSIPRGLHHSKSRIYENLQPICGNSSVSVDYPGSEPTRHTSPSTSCAYTGSILHGSLQSKKGYRRYRDKGNTGSHNVRRSIRSLHARYEDLCHLSDVSLKGLIIDTLVSLLRLHLSNSPPSSHRIKKDPEAYHRDHHKSRRTHASPSSNSKPPGIFVPDPSSRHGRLRNPPPALSESNGVLNTRVRRRNRLSPSVTAHREQLPLRSNPDSDSPSSDVSGMMQYPVSVSQADNKVFGDRTLNSAVSGNSRNNHYPRMPHLMSAHPKLTSSSVIHTHETPPSRLSSPSHSSRTQDPIIVPNKRAYSNNGTLKKTRFERQAHVLSRSPVPNSLYFATERSIPR